MTASTKANGNHDGLLGFSGPDVPPRDVIDACVHCGFCLPVCPTYRETYRERSSPRGRIWLIKAVSDGELDLRDPVFQDEMSLCLNCRACEAVCPSGVKYGELVEMARAQIAAHDPPPAHERAARAAAFGGLFASPRAFRMASRGLRIYERSGMRTVLQRSGVLEKTGLARQEALMPAMSDEFLAPGGERWQAEGTYRGTVALLAGCIMSTAYAEVHRATARVLARNGFEVIVPPGQGCCGALAVHAGDPEQGRKLARRNIESFDSPEIDAVIVNAAGCGAAMKEYDFLLRHDPAFSERAGYFTGKVRDATEFLAEAGLARKPGRLDIRVTYQEPCHLAHAQRITEQPRELLRSIPGLELVEMAEASLCCGSAGIYNLLRPEMADALGDRKLDNALATCADVIVSANPGCMMQIEAGLRRRSVSSVRVEHIMTLLDRAYAVED